MVTRELTEPHLVFAELDPDTIVVFALPSGPLFQEFSRRIAPDLTWRTNGGERWEAFGVLKNSM